MTEDDLDPTLAADLTAELEDLLDEYEPAGEQPSHIIREERRRYERMNERRYVKAENPAPPLSADIIEQLLAESAALADGGDLHSAQKLASIAGQIARAAQVVSELSSPPKMTGSLVHFDLQNENRATIQVSASAAKVSFSKLLMHAMNGDTVLIEKFGKPVARLVPIERDQTRWSEER